MANMTSPTTICCLALSLLLNNKTVFLGEQAYTESIGSYFSLQQTEISPSCIVLPDTAQEVSTIVQVLTNTTLSASGCQFAVRSGGHSSFEGASNIQGGVTIDLRGLNSIELSQDRSNISVGVGTTWGGIYSQLDNLNLTVSGGRSASVGVGGLTIGGGISYFGPRYGWTCDTASNFEVVLADGSIVNANENENIDLLWALRGGANNFGIVTRVELQAFEQGKIWGGTVTYALSTANEQIIALSNFSMSSSYDEYSSLITTFAYSGTYGVSVVVNSMEHTKAVVDPPTFQQFSEIPSLESTMRLTNMTDLSAETEALQVIGLRERTGTLTIAPTIDALNATVQAWNASIATIRDIPGIVWSIVFDPLPPAIYAQHAKTNALGFTGRDNKPLMVVQLSITWSEAEDDVRVGAAARALIETIEQNVDKLGALDPYVYLNYAAPWQEPISSYGELSVARLTKVRRRYDPRRVFTNLVPGGFKLPE